MRPDECDDPGSVTSIGSLCVHGCNLTTVTIPGSVTSIGDSAFDGCNLTTVTIPSGVTSIGDSTFDGCVLTSVTIPAASLPSGLLLSRMQPYKRDDPRQRHFHRNLCVRLR